MSSPRGIPRPNSPHSHPSSDRPPRSSSRASPPPPCDDQLRLEALHALVRLADAGARASASTVSSSSSFTANARPRALGDAQTLAAALVYALSAAEALDAHAGVDGVEARARDASRAFAMTCRATSPSDALFAQRVGATLIAGCKTLHPRRYYPRAASAAAAAARDALASSADGASADVADSRRRGPTAAAEGARTPSPGRDANRRRNDDSNHRGRILADRVARVWSGVVGESDGSRDARRGDGVEGVATRAFRLPTHPSTSAADAARFCAVAAFAVSARACLVERAYPIDAAFIDASIRAACACLRVPFALLTSLERVEPSAAAARVRLATLAPSAMFAPSLMTRIATRVDASPTLRDRAASTTFAYASRFARRFHESYRGFKSRADPRRVAAMDPDAIRPAFLGVFRATIAFARVAPMTTARDVVAAAEAVAAVEFARAPDSNYAPALQRIAAAMSADHSVARDARLAFLEFAFPDERELDTPVSVSTGSTGFTGSTEFAGWTGRVDAASDSSESSSAPGNTVGVAWRDDDVFGTRLHLLLRLFPFAAPGPDSLGDGGGERLGDESSRRRFGNGYGSASRGSALSRAMPAALRCVGHPRAAIARAAHVAHVAAFRSHAELHEVWFLPYLDAALERFPGNTPGNRRRAWARREEDVPGVTAAEPRDASRRAEALDVFANVAGSNPNPEPIDAAVAFAASVSVEARARARRRRRFVDCVRSRRARRSRARAELRDACEAAVMGAGARGFESQSGRIAAYEDLVDGVLGIGDYARKSDAVRWALRLRSRI